MKRDLLTLWLLCVVAAVAGLLLGILAHGAERAPAPKDAGPVTFDEIVSAALVDAKALPADVAGRTRYLSAAHLPREERKELYAVVSYHVNALSRGADLVAPRKVTEWLWAVDLGDYHWDRKVWEDLKRANHYFAIKTQAVAVAVPVKKTRQVQRYDEHGRSYLATEEYTEAAPAVPAKEDFIPAPWLPPAASAGLAQLTGSATAVVRADEFVFQTLAQAKRDGHGYYDFLGLGKKLADAEELAGLDRKRAIKQRSELAAAADISGVALANRQLFRYGVIDGAWWESRDADGNTDDKNAIDHLHEDFKPDAFETVGRLRNGLPFFGLWNKDGVRQDAAPDFIASNRKTADNDARVHVGYGCIVCHTDGGLRPIDDYFRAVYTRESGLQLTTVAADPERAERNRAYTREIQKPYDRDRGDYAAAIEEACGLKPAALSAAVQRQWGRYIGDPVTRAQGAAEMGVTEAELRAAIERYSLTKGGLADPFVAQWRPEKARVMRREHFENRFPVFMLVLKGVDP